MSLQGGGEKVGSGSRPDSREHDHCFPRAWRLTARRQYLRVYSHGHRTRCPSLTLFGLPNRLGHCRLGITVTRKVGCAVTRNRIKRLVREAFRRNRFRMDDGLDLVVNAHIGIDTTSALLVEKELLKCYSRLSRRLRQ